MRAKKPVCFRCVAMMDVLGFQARLSRASVERIASDIDLLVTGFPTQQDWAVVTLDGKGTSGRDRINKLLFSDTIFFWSDEIAEEGIRREARLSSFVSMIGRIILRGLILGIPLRAGLAYGEVFVDSRKLIVVGQPIVDAHNVEESQDWVGGALHHSFPVPAHAFGSVTAYEVPTKLGANPLRHAVDWTHNALFPLPEWGPQVARRISTGVLRTLERRTDHGLSSSVRQKYNNAMLFLMAQRDYAARGKAWRGKRRIRVGKWVPPSMHSVNTPAMDRPAIGR